MNGYANIKDGEVVTTVSDREQLPVMWTWPDGSMTSNFNTMSDEELAEAGWFPVLDDQPKFNDKKQQLINEKIVARDGLPVRTWDIEDIPPVVVREPVIPEPSDKERISALEAEVSYLKEEMKKLKS